MGRGRDILAAALSGFGGGIGPSEARLLGDERFTGLTREDIEDILTLPLRQSRLENIKESTEFKKASTENLRNKRIGPSKNEDLSLFKASQQRVLSNPINKLNPNSDEVTDLILKDFFRNKQALREGSLKPRPVKKESSTKDADSTKLRVRFKADQIINGIQRKKGDIIFISPEHLEENRDILEEEE